MPGITDNNGLYNFNNFVNNSNYTTPNYGLKSYTSNNINSGDFWDFNNPKFKDFSEEDIQTIVSEMDQNINIYSGLSVLGGEPFSVKNIDDAITLCKSFKEKFSEKNIWIWSGHELQWLNSQKDEYGEKIKQLLDLCDVLVDGHFDVSRRNISLKFRGSENQIIWEKDENKNWFKSKLNEK